MQLCFPNSGKCSLNSSRIRISCGRTRKNDLSISFTWRLIRLAFLLTVLKISDTVIEDRFGVQHGTEEWYSALDRHFKWLLQYKISPYFCRWGDSMRVLTYTSPWPGIFV